MNYLKKLSIDPFLFILLATVATATLLPCTGAGKTVFENVTTAAIALLFFMHGAKLSRQAVFMGIGHWRLHLCVLASTFVLFPILGLVFSFVPTSILSPELYQGFLYLCVLPSTVQSSIAFTSMAGGNVAAAICSASASSILGVFLSPLLASFLLNSQKDAPNILQAIGSILLQLMLPFVAGHLLRPLLMQFMDKHRKLINITDRTSILLVVYTAFSSAVLSGIWSKVSPISILAVCGASILLLGLVLLTTTFAAKKLGFGLKDEITIVFCGSKKSLANGVPMAKVLFPSASVGIMVLPLMLFHQIQLMVCAVLASRYALKTKVTSNK